MKKLMGEPVCGGESGDESASTERLIFTKGARVEVTRDEEGHKGAWYAATIINVPPLNKKKRKRETNHPKYVVEYETLLAEDDQTKQLRESVELSFMRPLPPDDDDRQPSFEKNDAVDVFYRDGWWSGVISSVATDGDGIGFVVSFDNPPDEMQCDASQIRVHRDWVDRKWVTPGKQEIIEPYGGAFCQKRKWGRPRKLPAVILAGWVAVKEKNGVEALSYEAAVKDCGTNMAVQSSATTEVCVRGMVGMKNDAKVDNGSNEIILCKPDMQLKRHSSTTSELPTQVDSQDACHGKISEVAEADCASKDVEVAMKEIPSHTFDDRSQLMVFEGVNSPRTVDDSGTSLGETVKHCAEKCGTKDENVVQSLPFVKRSPVWKFIECLEVFQSMPQQPHFSPLEKV